MTSLSRFYAMNHRGVCAMRTNASRAKAMASTSAPQVKCKYRQPMLSARVHTAASGHAAEVAHNEPRKQARDGVSDGPPDGHEGDEPCVASGEELEQVCGIEDVVADSTGRVDGHAVWLTTL